jgi:hypothetical protein
MGQRRALVVGSQCDALSNLDFLPDYAESLYAVLTDPNLGGCQSALPGRSGLVLDPTRAETEEMIERAFESASAAGDMLLLALIGHGWGERERFYFLAKDSPFPPTFRSAVRLAEFLSDLWGRHSAIDGLLLLVDTCYAGVAGLGTATVLGRELSLITRYEVLTASGTDAYDGCFTRVLVQTLRKGLRKGKGETVLCRHVTAVLDQECIKKQVSDHFSRKPNDESMFLARNVAPARTRRPWERSSHWETLDALTRWFQPTTALKELVEFTQTRRAVVVIGAAGSGKSALVAVLARPEMTAKAVPKGFVQAIVFLTATSQMEILAKSLSTQLIKTVKGFKDAVMAYQRSVTFFEWQRCNSLQRMLLGPLHFVARDHPVRIIIDGLDQLSESVKEGVHEALNQLSEDDQWAHVRLVMTSRPGVKLPKGTFIYHMPPASDEEIGQYWTRRALPERARAALSAAPAGSWLVARLVADLGASVQAVSGPALANLYDQSLLALGAAPDNLRWQNQLLPVLSVLAVAGVGAILPFRLLCVTSGGLAGPSQPGEVRDLLLDLHPYLNHASPGLPEERVGFFHASLAEYLLNPQTGWFTVDSLRTRKELLKAIVELAPAEAHDPKDPLHQYAFAQEAELLWDLGEHEAAFWVLAQRESVIPEENLVRWQGWYEYIMHSGVDPDHPDVLTTRHNIAYWTGEVGDAHQAMTLFKALLPDVMWALGPGHPLTFTTCHNFARWTGEAGDAQRAVTLFEALLPDMVRVLGPDHLHTLTSRHNLARWTGEIGDAHRALELFEMLLPDMVRVLGPDHLHTLATRHNLAYWTAKAGDARQALKLFEMLLPDMVRVLGPDHPLTLSTRHNLASWTGEIGDAHRALELFEALLPDRIRVLGPDHPETLTARHNLASWMAKAGEARQALKLFEMLLPDMVRVLGPDHPETLTARLNLASWTGEIGDAHRALELFEMLLPDQIRVLGPDHPDTLTARHNLASWMAKAGEAHRALELSEMLLPDRIRVLGPDHPETLATRHNLAYWTGEAGDAQRAVALFEALLPDMVRVLGPDHPDTLTSRLSIAYWTAKAGDAHRALELSEMLLPDQMRVLGPDHLHTLVTADWIRLLKRQGGE